MTDSASAYTTDHAFVLTRMLRVLGLLKLLPSLSVPDQDKPFLEAMLKRAAFSLYLDCRREGLEVRYLLEASRREDAGASLRAGPGSARPA